MDLWPTYLPRKTRSSIAPSRRRDEATQADGTLRQRRLTYGVLLRCVPTSDVEPTSITGLMLQPLEQLL